MDTIINITRNRNIYTIELDTGKHITAYLERPFRLVGISGKELASCPKQISERLGKAFLNAADEHRDLTNREYVDRVISLPDISINIKVFAMECLFYSVWNEQHHDLPAWKDTLALLRKWNTNPNNLPSVDYMDNLVNRDLGVNILEQHGLTQYAPYISLTLLPYIKSCKAFRSALRTAAIDRYAEPQAKVKELLHLDNEDELLNFCGIQLYEYNAEEEINGVCRKMKRIADYLTKMKLTLNDYKVENLDRALADLEARYEAERTARESRKFREAQTTHNLFYENDRYYTRVPLNRAECKEIGDHFRNCVNSYEWDNYLCRGERYLVVVCDKVTNEMLVCVDIIPHDMRIHQFYGYRNEYIGDRNLLNFREEYQTYLLSNA